MTVIGITGPSGSGKSAVSEHLKQIHGFKVIDADEVYHGIISQPSDCVRELVEAFGEGILSQNGGIDRKVLAKLVFGEENKERLLILNKITHKYVDIEIKRLLESYAANGEEFCAIDAPLLVEAGINKICDYVIAVVASREKRAERISKRDGIDHEAAILRIDSQKPDSFYEENSDFVIQNNLNLKELSLFVNMILRLWSIIK